ncbi:apolipoprotein D-like [Frankliniella occidentalis]|uniref:Apolipoprotein D-like n=1 Tax=Frankliniella occidentalis TaxID=133901 RepID=A0A9C6U787_FRAOC|nr:apolipoprotein D-like [Frankliniella occidentalis]
MRTIFGNEVSQSGYADITSQDKGELNVVFQVPIFGKREAPYWVLETDYYNFSLVYSCSDILGFLKIESAWVLARYPTLSNEVQQKVDAAIEKHNIKKRAFRPTKQDC